MLTNPVVNVAAMLRSVRFYLQRQDSLVLQATVQLDELGCLTCPYMLILLAEISWRYPGYLSEQTAEMVLVGNTDLFWNVLQRCIGGNKQAFGPFDTVLTKILHRRAAPLFFIRTQEVIATHASDISQIIQVER